jgi:hypothetical protein
MIRRSELVGPILLVLALVVPGRANAQHPLLPQRADVVHPDLLVEQKPLSSDITPQLPDPLGIRLPEPPRPSQTQSDRRHLEIKQATIFFFQKMSKDPHHDVEVFLKQRKLLSGRVLSADNDGFVFRPRHSKQQTTIRYDDVDYWRQVPTEGMQVLQTTALIVLAIPLFPLFFLAGLAGWEGC